MVTVDTISIPMILYLSSLASVCTVTAPRGICSIVTQSRVDVSIKISSERQAAAVRPCRRKMLREIPSAIIDKTSKHSNGSRFIRNGPTQTRVYQICNYVNGCLGRIQKDQRMLCSVGENSLLQVRMRAFAQQNGIEFRFLFLRSSKLQL